MVPFAIFVATVLAVLSGLHVHWAFSVGAGVTRLS